MADEARAKRAAALEEKKRRLEALKARRTNRSAEGGEAASAAAAASSSATSASAGNLDDYIDDLLSAKAPEILGASSPVAPVPAAPVPTEPKEAEAPSAPAPSAPVAAATEPVQVAAEPAPAPTAPPARKAETFTCGTQTEEGDFPPSAEDEEEEEKKRREEEEEKKKAEEEEKKEEGDSGGAPSSPVKALSPDEVESTVRTAPFSKFLNSASKRVERLLGAPVLADLLVDADYARETDAEAEETAERDRKAREEKEGGGRGDLVRARVAFECARWTAGRDCTDLDWSPVHRELMLASYHAPYHASAAEGGAGAEGGGAGGGGGGGSAVRGISPDDTPSASLVPRSGELQSDGLALVWSLAMPARPEHVFTCGSPVLVGRFHPTERQLVVGGCQSGQVVVWDIRAGRLPVQRSTMAVGTGGGLRGHAHPICSMEVVEGGSGLVTAATDGLINFWSVANLRDPAESLTVGSPVSCLAVAPESGTLVCGDEGGGLHAVLTSADSSAGPSSSSPSFRRTTRRIDAGSLDTGGDRGGAGHFGMVTSVATKPPPQTGGHISRGFLRGAPGLVLTTGVDWTTRLWAPAYTDSPLLSLLSHSYDYMCDVQWSPVHPSVFAAASSDGNVGLWNLAASLDEPVSGSDGIAVDGDGGSDPAAAGGGGAPPRGLNKIRWSRDGRRIAAASSDRLHVLSVADEITRPKADDEAKMMSNLTARGLLDEL